MNNLRDRVRRLERGRQTVDAALFKQWFEILTALAEPMSDEEIREQARFWAAEGKTPCRVWGEILLEIWAQQPERPVNLQ